MKRKSLLTLLTLLSALFGSGWNASAQILTTLINEGTNEELMIEEKPVTHRKTSARFVPAPIDGERINLVLKYSGRIFVYNSVFEDSAWIDLNGNEDYDEGEALVNGEPLSCQQEEVTIYGKISRFCLLPSSFLAPAVALDASKCESLIYLDVRGQNLASLDLSANKALTTLDCSNNQLSGLDLSDKKALTYLNCSNNQLSSLDLSDKKALTTLYCSNNQLSNLDLSDKKALTTLYCNNNQLSSLDLSDNTSLMALGCDYNQLSNLNIETCPDLKIISCAGNTISQLEISHNPKIEAIYIDGNKIQEGEMRKLVESLPVLDTEEAINSYNPMSLFSDLYVLNSKNEDEQNEFPLDLLPIAKAKGWVARDKGLSTNENGNQTFNDNAIEAATYEVTPQYIDIRYKEETVGQTVRIGLAGESLWTDLNGNGQYDQGESIRSTMGINIITPISLSTPSLRIYGKNITKITAAQFEDIDLSKVKNLRRIWCGWNYTMTPLNLKENKELRVLQFIFMNAELESIETDCPKLHTLVLSGDTKYRPDLSKFPKLKLLGVNNMELTQLDVSQNPELVYLDCSYNKLTGLDLSHNPDLRYLKCSNNLIDEAAMQALVESLPEVIIRDEPANFIPVNPDGDDNVCTPDQVAIAKSKNWNVTTPMGEPFVGTSIEEVIPAEVYHNIKVWARDGILYLSGLEPGMPVQVYALSGTMMHTSVASGSMLEIPLPRGVAYVLRAGNHAVKAVMP